jgi:hypothetical protein
MKHGTYIEARKELNYKRECFDSQKTKVGKQYPNVKLEMQENVVNLEST